VTRTCEGQRVLWTVTDDREPGILDQVKSGDGT
jgi:hypothetical protein